MFALTSSEFLTENEIAAAELADEGGVFNPQQQFPVTWPAHPVVARAYMDQLKRSDSLSVSLQADVNTALENWMKQIETDGKDKKVAAKLKSLARSVKSGAGDAIATKQRAGLAETLKGLAAQLL